jgi:uncharacterized SAM-dependent methyltransferase
MVSIDVLLTERELADEFVAALERRYLAEKFFYWLPLSVKAWLELCQASQPYRNFSRSYQLVAAHAAEVAGRLEAAVAELVSLGAGQGDKELRLLEALVAHGTRVSYRPVDSSQALLELAVGCARAAGYATRGLKADVEEGRTTEALAASDSTPRLYAVLGNTLGVIHPADFLARLCGLVRGEDWLLVDGEVFRGEATLAGYDNQVNRRFAFAPLASIGLEEGRDGVLVFSVETDPRVAGLHVVSKYFRAARPLSLAVAGQRVELAAGEKILMNGSYKYAPGALPALVGAAGFAIEASYASADEGFLLLLARPEGR